MSIHLQFGAGFPTSLPADPACCPSRPAVDSLVYPGKYKRALQHGQPNDVHHSWLSGDDAKHHENRSSAAPQRSMSRSTSSGGSAVNCNTAAGSECSLPHSDGSTVAYQFHLPGIVSLCEESAQEERTMSTKQFTHSPSILPF